MYDEGVFWGQIATLLRHLAAETLHPSVGSGAVLGERLARNLAEEGPLVTEVACSCTELQHAQWHARLATETFIAPAQKTSARGAMRLEGSHRKQSPTATVSRSMPSQSG